MGSLTSWIFFIFGYVVRINGWNNFLKFEHHSSNGSRDIVILKRFQKRVKCRPVIYRPEIQMLITEDW